MLSSYGWPGRDSDPILRDEKSWIDLRGGYTPKIRGRIWNEYGEERYANGKPHPRQSVRSGFDSRLPLPSPQPTSKAAGTPTLLAI